MQETNYCCDGVDCDELDRGGFYEWTEFTIKVNSFETPGLHSYAGIDTYEMHICPDCLPKPVSDFINSHRVDRRGLVAFCYSGYDFESLDGVLARERTGYGFTPRGNLDDDVIEFATTRLERPF